MLCRSISILVKFGNDSALTLLWLIREQVHPDIYSIIGDFTKINILEICQDYNLSFIQRVQFIQKQLWNDMEQYVV